MALPTYTMRNLLEAGVHFGHHTRRWNPKMAPYIFGARNGIHIIDLEQTVPMLHQGLQAIRDVVAGGGRVLLVGTKRQAQEPIAEASKRCGQYYVNYRWLGGMLTNFKTMSQSIRRLRELDERINNDQSRADQARTAGVDAPPRQARTCARRHQGDGRTTRHLVRYRHQQGSNRRGRGQYASLAGRRDPRFELVARRDRLPDSRKRRRDAGDPSLLRPRIERGPRRAAGRACRLGRRHWRSRRACYRRPARRGS